MNDLKKKIWLIVAISILIIIFAPYLLTWSGSEELSFLETGQIEDTIGGITSPIVGLVSIVLLALTLIEQLKFNVEQVQLSAKNNLKIHSFSCCKSKGKLPIAYLQHTKG